MSAVMSGVRAERRPESVPDAELHGRVMALREGWSAA
jgi:MoxR-like ATPase